MTIASTVNKSGPFTCNGVTTDFPGGFKISDESHVKVVHADASGAETVLDLSSGDYTVSGVGGDDFNVSIVPALADGKVTLVLNVPLTQNIDFENQGEFFAETVEEALDLGVQRALQIQEQVDRAVKLPVSSTDDPEQLAVELFAAKDAAVGSASAASASATSASDSATAAASSASAAAASEGNASDSATAAASSASAAATSEGNASDSATAAASSASSASASESAAADSASDASASATSASDSATAAASSASSASASESAAADSASDASASATSAAASAAAVTPATASDFLSDANSNLLPVSAVWDAGEEVTVAFGSTVTLDFATFINAMITLTGNVTFAAPTNQKPGQGGCIRIIQDATGSRTAAFNTAFKWVGGTTGVLSTAANAQDLLYYHIVEVGLVHLSLNKAIG